MKRSSDSIGGSIRFGRPVTDSREGRLGLSRFNHDADTLAEVQEYLRERAIQLLQFGCRFGEQTVLEEGVIQEIDFEGERYQAFYLYKSHRGKGNYVRIAKQRKLRILTVQDCAIEGYLWAHHVPCRVVGKFLESTEYRMISHSYGTKRAERSGVLYMRHIDEGLAILARIGASDWAKRAYCIHPLVQSDDDLVKFMLDYGKMATKFGHLDPRVVALAMEYRAIANASLSTRSEILDDPSTINLGPLPDVEQMLVADKVQNRKDFDKYNRASYPRSVELDKYFRSWMTRLSITEEKYQSLLEGMD